jgi:PAS domain S-box-containing protein
MGLLHSDEIDVGYGSGKGADACRVGVDAAYEAMEGIDRDSLSVVLVFASVKYDLERMLHGVGTVVGEVPVIGATTAGEICNASLSESVVVVALASPHLSVKWGIGRNVSFGWQNAVHEAIDSSAIRPYFTLGANGIWSDLNRQGKSVFGMVFSPGNTRHSDSRGFEILNSLKEASQGRISIFGAGAADDWHMESNFVLCGERAYPDSLLVAVFETRLKVGIGSSHGFRPSDLRAVVTKVRGREVRELNGRPAAEQYAGLLGTTVRDLEGKHLTMRAGRPVGAHDTFGQWDIKVASYITPGGGIRLSQPVVEGCVLAVMEADPESIIHAGREALKNGLMQGHIKYPAMAIVFSCALRSKFLGPRGAEEMENMMGALPEVPIVGFYSFGEQAMTQDGVCRHANGTIGVLVLGRELSMAAEVSLENERLLSTQRMQEIRLWESRRNLQTLLDSVDDLIFVLDKDGLILSANAAVKGCLGLSMEELGKMRIQDLHPRERHREACRIWAEITAGHAHACNVPFITARGDLVEMEARVSGGTWNGRPAFFAVFRDVSQRVFIQRQLSEGRERLELALKGADLGMWDWNLSSGEVYYGERWAGMLGYSPAEIAPDMASWAQLVHPDDRRNVEDGLREHLRGKTPFFQAEYRMRNKSGLWKWVLARGRVTERGPDGMAVRMAGTYMDITERKEAELNLRLFRQIIDTTSQAVSVSDREGRLVYINAAHEKLFGRPFHEAIKIDHHAHYPSESIEILTGTVNPSLARGEGWAGELSAFDAGGRMFPLWMRADAICDGDGKLLYAFCIMYDITELKESEAGRLDMERRLLLAQKRESLGYMAGGVAHHFNNLMMAVMGNLELFRDELQQHGRGLRILNQAQAAARRARDLSRLMLTYLGHGVGMRGLCHISTEIQKAIPLIEESLPPNVQLKMHLAPVLPQIRADVDTLRRVVLNLTTNACESLHDKGGEVAIRTGVDVCDEAFLRMTVGTETLAPGRYVYLEVSDNGCGMDADTVARMFDPFFSTKFIGRGLGLATVMGIVQGHGGGLAVTSRQGAGAVVRALFPVAAEGGHFADSPQARTS